MNTVSYTLLQSNVQELNYTGPALRVDPSLGNTNGLHTVGYSMEDFVGTVHIEATLANDPTEADWFDVVSPYKFPRDPANPTGTNLGDTGTNGHTFRANLTYMRIRIDRSDVEETEYDSKVHGIITRALLNV